MAGRRDRVAAAGDNQIVLGDDTVPAGGGDGQRTLFVERQVGFGKHRAVNVVVVQLDKGFAACQRVLSAGCCGDEYLVGLSDIERGAVRALDGCAVQYQLEFVGVVGVDDHHAVIQCAGQDVGTLVGDGDGAADYCDRVAVAFGGCTVQGDMCGG